MLILDRSDKVKQKFVLIDYFNDLFRKEKRKEKE